MDWKNTAVSLRWGRSLWEGGLWAGKPRPTPQDSSTLNMMTSLPLGQYRGRRAQKAELTWALSLKTLLKSGWEQRETRARWRGKVPMKAAERGGGRDGPPGLLEPSMAN